MKVTGSNLSPNPSGRVNFTQLREREREYHTPHLITYMLHLLVSVYLVPPCFINWLPSLGGVHLKKIGIGNRSHFVNNDLGQVSIDSHFL